jgi:UTP--glucose-1-phosphate uridylyltransferase
MVGDHVYMGDSTGSCAKQVIEVAEAEACAVSGVKATRENLLPYYGALGGSRVKGLRDLYAVERVREKPTPTEAEQTLLVPGLRTGHYLCLFGIHALTPAVMEILGERVAQSSSQMVGLTPALDALAGREKYLALETKGQRYPVDVPYGLFTAQLALALSGKDRAEVLSTVCEMLAQRDLGSINA